MAPPGPDFLYQKVVKRPPQSIGDRRKGEHFNVKLLNYDGGLSPPLREMMEGVRSLRTPIGHTLLGTYAKHININKIRGYRTF